MERNLKALIHAIQLNSQRCASTAISQGKIILKMNQVMKIHLITNVNALLMVIQVSVEQYLVPKS